MNRRDFLFFRKENANRAALSCEQLYMRCLDSTMDGSTSRLFENVESGLNGVRILEVRDAGWLNCEELKPLESIFSTFRQRGGFITME